MRRDRLVDMLETLDRIERGSAGIADDDGTVNAFTVRLAAYVRDLAAVVSEVLDEPEELGQ